MSRTISSYLYFFDTVRKPTATLIAFAQCNLAHEPFHIKLMRHKLTH